MKILKVFIFTVTFSATQSQDWIQIDNQSNDKLTIVLNEKTIGINPTLISSKLHTLDSNKILKLNFDTTQKNYSVTLQKTNPSPSPLSNAEIIKQLLFLQTEGKDLQPVVNVQSNKKLLSFGAGAMSYSSTKGICYLEPELDRKITIDV